MDFDLGTPRATIAFAKKVAESAKSLKSPNLTVDQAEEVVSRIESQAWQDERQKRRDLRKLPWLLTAGSPPLYRRLCFPQLLPHLSGQLSGLKLKGLIYSCLMLDTRIEAERADILCKLALSSIAAEKRQNQAKGRQLNPFLQHWEEWSDVLKRNGNSAVGSKLLDGSLKDWRERLRVPTNSPRMPDLLRSVAQACCQKAEHKIPELLDSLGQSPSLEQKAVLINEILSSKLAMNKLEPNQSLISFGLRHFGDPRTDTKARWSSVSQSGRNLVSRWLSEEDLRIFFTYLGGDAKSERRKNYWSKFIVTVQP